ncbi:hypothetical protein [Thermococcus peptonophilus]|uniref:KaiC-like domain-containing protein n=1 Tax=Thermococcus peptonophilus TaxID=53952 RepID=A0A142CTU9_9EURY|nr:hypothetical protein [Thermococcus peptonophilus]AMQ18201.1 hypothetical protein A0127_02980 [Thermococcus peptonophilus]
MRLSRFIDSVPENGVLTVVARGPDSNGDVIGIKLLKELIRRGESVFVVLYEPLLVFKSNLEREGVPLEKTLSENFIVFDVFGSFKGIERDLPYVYQLKGYLDDGVFVTKYSDFVRALSGRISTRRIWLFSYLSSGVCKLFKNPKKTYQLIWSTKAGVADKIPDIRAILVYDSTDCPEIENFIYTLSDIVVEVLRDNFERRAYITKGLEPAVFNPFEGGEND